MTKIPVGYLILTTTPPEDIGGVARQIEELGFDELWVGEDYFFYGGFTAAEKALADTSRIEVKMGIISAVARHPAVTAMEVANLARSYPGRFSVGIGHGVPAWTHQMGLTPKSPLKSLRQCVSSVTALLAGETLNSEGDHFVFRDVRLAHPATTPVPVLTGVVGPKSLQLSGEIADGTVMSVLASPQYLESAIAEIRTGMAVGGRSTHAVPTFAISSVGEDRALARAAVRPLIATYVAAMTAHSPLITKLGHAEKVTELLERGGTDALANEMPESWIDDFAVAGNPDDVVAGIERLHRAGATSVVLTSNPATADAELALISKSVLPKLS